MPIWTVADVTDQPHITLWKWKVVEFPDCARHFVGFALETQSGRVSSEILTFDESVMRGVTRSGRVYQLRGAASSFQADAEYVLAQWARFNGYDRWKDVSSEIATIFQNSLDG